MRKKWLFVIVGVIVIAVITASLTLWFTHNSKNKEDTLQPLITKDNELEATLSQICGQYKQPAMACALVNSQGIMVKAAAGTAVYGEDQPVNIKNRFHIGSTTKSMTALLVQMLVNEGKLSYDTTLEKALPDIAMRSEYKDVTIRELLLHQAGIIAFQRLDLENPVYVQKLWVEIPAEYTNPVEQRREAAKYALNLDPIAEPGTKAIYSNVDYSIAGLIVETAAGKPYEEFIKEKIFDPLGMKDARIGGWPASPAEPDQPRGHYPVSGGNPKPQDLADAYIFPDWMNPSGGVCCSIVDYAQYVMENLAGLKGHGKLLDKKAYENIHSIHLTTKISDMYIGMEQDDDITMGYGWVVFPVEGGNLSAADGSGGTFYAKIAVYPALDVAFAGFTNCGDGSPALNEAIKKITGLDINL
jgi:CubicO group peptidase (beta-lactamase class C family)